MIDFFAVCCDSFFYFFSFAICSFSSFGVGSLRYASVVGALPARSSAQPSWRPLASAPPATTDEGDERERQLQQTHLCFSVQHSVGLLQPRRRAAEEPLIGQRGSHGDRDEEGGMSCGGWVMIGRVK